MITELGKVAVSKEMRKLARSGYSASTTDGFTNSINIYQIPDLINMAALKGYCPVDKVATNFWGRCNVRPHTDDAESDYQLLWAIDWTQDVLFYSGNVAKSLVPSEVYLFRSNTDLHGIYVNAAHLWSCIVLDVEPTQKQIYENK